MRHSTVRLRVAAAALSLVTACFALLLVPGAAGQREDDVHLTPREKPAQVAGQALLAHSKPIRSDVNVVLVPVTVTDAKSRPLVSLGKDNFLLYEGEQLQNIRYFSLEDVPISIGVLLDLSKSMSNKIDLAREALGEFFKTANPEDDYFVVTFADRPQVLADTTQSVGTIRAKLADAVASGHTALLDAIYLGLNKLRHARYKRRALLIISDGGDNCSRYRTREIKSLVQESDVEIYAIGIFDSIFKTPEEWAGKRLLSEITQATGGHTVALGNARQLPEVAAAISLELRSQYVLGYQPSNTARDGSWRKIKVRLAPSATPEPAQVYAKHGYQAPEK
ncbi:MAG TPA: VWA domain-containing protein [Terriglobales bacterium]|nr:VWA domain-containing protein [Terriglobales bacterium]